MEIALRSALIGWLASDTALSAQLNAVVEEVPSRTAKDRRGREVRVALELHCRGDRPDSAATLVGQIEARIASLPAAQSGFRVVTTQFLRARAEQRGSNTRAILLEYRFRVMAD
jgi:hypothetical protein